MNLVVFASGSGTNFQSIIDAVENGKIDARIAGLVSDKKGIKALERAEKHGIPTAVINPGNYEDRAVYTNELLAQLKRWDTDLIALAGYIKKIPEKVVHKYADRILNIHPALLPKFGGKGFYGSKVHQAVIEAGEKESGCTVHVVTEEFDEGPVLAQRKVPVLEGDTPEDLAKRVLEQEHKVYPETIQNFILTLKSS